jgi:carbon-monoxide dehydrogenase medium subunit
VVTAHPLLREAIAHVAHYQIRNRGTVGGSLAHADPAAELPGSR